MGTCDWENCTQPAVRNERYCALHMLEFQPDYVIDATDAWRQRAETAEAALALRRSAAGDDGEQGGAGGRGAGALRE